MKSKTKVLGLVGPIGAGKSAAAGLLADRGARVIDADRIAHEVLAEPRVVRALVKRWGPSVAPKGRVNRSAVAGRVFADDAERRFLEDLVHPPVIKTIRAAIREARRKGEALVVLDAPLLVEVGLHKECDAVLYIDAPKAARLRRARSKELDATEVARRERAMTPLGVKRRLASRVIRNDDSLARMAQRITRFLETYGWE